MSILLVYLGYHFDLPLWYMVVAWYSLFWRVLRGFTAFVKGIYKAGQDGKRESD